ncbi:MAG: PAS domain S-box protein, partial [Methanoregula sp.]|nr:PAS domain S-box protein [Methanoregula sp.]
MAAKKKNVPEKKDEGTARPKRSLRKGADEALRESEDKYRTVFENTGTATVVVDESSIISLANTEFAHLSGFSKDEIEGKKSWTEFVVKEDLERMLDQHRLRMQNREKALTHYEFRFVTKSGDIRTIYLSIDVIPGTKKSIASLMDITERKRAEELYQTIFENTGTAMIILEEDTTIAQVNEEMENIWGYSKEEIEGRVKWPTLVAEEDLEKMLEYHCLRRTNPDSAPRNYEFRFIHKNGGLRDAALTAAMITGTTKSVISLRDITEFKKTEEALRENEDKFRVLSEQSILGIGIIQDGIYQYFNQGYCVISGYSEDEIRRWQPYEYAKTVHPDDLDLVMEQVQKKQMNSPDAVTHYSFRALNKEGAVLLLDLYSKTIMYHGRPADFVTFIDITEQKRAGETEQKLTEFRESVITNARVWLSVLDHRGKILMWNTAAEE